MKFSSFTCGYQRRTLELAFSDARDFGYDGIEIWGCRPHAYAPDLNAGRIENIKRLSDRYQLPIVGYSPKVNSYPYNLMVGERDMWEDSLNYIRRAMDAAVDMGAGFTLIALGHAGDLADRTSIERRMDESLKRLGEYAVKKDTLLIIEPLSLRESNTLTCAGELAAALDRLDCPNVAGMCDTVVPCIQEGESLDTYFELLGPRLKHIHMTDSDGVSEDHVLPGEGCAPLYQMLSTIKSRGYDGYITLELVTKYISNPSLYARLALEHMRRLERQLT